MKVIFAQGNPESRYNHTRHNSGFVTIDSCAKKWQTSFLLKDKFSAELAETTIDGEKILLVKPQTFYNETGRSARALIDFYKLDPATDLLVIHDDLALPFGKIRTRDSGSDAGNNGIKSLNAALGDQYHRIRIGIANDLREQMGDVDFVLGRFSKPEQDHLNKYIVPMAIELIEKFCHGQLPTTSHTITCEPNADS